VRVRLHPGAAEDLASAGDWYESQLPGLGLDLMDEVQRALDAICERPETWPLWPGIGEEVGVRRFLLARFPFSVAFIPRSRFLSAADTSSSRVTTSVLQKPQGNTERIGVRRSKRYSGSVSSSKTRSLAAYVSSRNPGSAGLDSSANRYRCPGARGTPMSRSSAPPRAR